jgi:nucleotide-binding universal stress UspA family protein
MFSLTKILAPIDFSERSPEAARYASAIACHFHSKLTLLYVIEPNMAAWGSLEFGAPMLEEVMESRQQRAAQDIAAFLPDLPTKVKRVIETGDPALRIVERAHGDQTSLIVMPTHGYGPFRRFILGSVTAKVLHDAACPVLTGVHVSEPAGRVFGMSHVVCAIGLGQDGRRVLEWAGGFAAGYGSRLTVLTISPELEPHFGKDFDPRWQSDLRSQARIRMEQLLQELGLQADVVVESAGHVPEAVCSAAERLEASLLVIGRKKNSGEFMGRLRTKSYSVIRQSTCPVISV